MELLIFRWARKTARFSREEPDVSGDAGETVRITLQVVGTNPDWDRQRILVVDDGAADLRRLLSSEGYVIDEAADGPSAASTIWPGARRPVAG